MPAVPRPVAAKVSLEARDILQFHPEFDPPRNVYQTIRQNVRPENAGLSVYRDWGGRWIMAVSSPPPWGVMRG